MLGNLITKLVETSLEILDILIDWYSLYISGFLFLDSTQMKIIDMPLFWNVPDFQTPMFVSFFDALLMYSKKSEVVFPFFWKKTSQWWHLQNDKADKWQMHLIDFF